MKCPKCNTEILTENINIQTDIAQCHHCHTIFKISENIDGYIDDNFDENDTPDGTWIKKDFNQTIIGATTRSAMAFFLVPFMLIWTGGSVGMIYGTQFVSGKFDLFESLFGIPFLIGAIIFWTFALMAIWGKVELTLDSQGGKIFTGIGNIGLVKKFLWSEIKTVKESQANFRYPGSHAGTLVIEGQKKITFGIGVSDERRYYLLNAIKSVMIKQGWDKK